jgi:hypothetical protein
MIVAPDTFLARGPGWRHNKANQPRIDVVYPDISHGTVFYHLRQQNAH